LSQLPEQIAVFAHELLGNLHLALDFLVMCRQL
jgi:hypothetical protein